MTITAKKTENVNSVGEDRKVLVHLARYRCRYPIGRESSGSKESY